MAYPTMRRMGDLTDAIIQDVAWEELPFDFDGSPKLFNPDEVQYDACCQFFYPNARVGDFYWNLTTVPELTEPNQRTLMILLPTANGECFAGFPVTHANPNGDQWQWDGNKDQPTLTPEIDLIGVWNGWVRQGTLVEAK